MYIVKYQLEKEKGGDREQKVPKVVVKLAVATSGRFKTHMP